jgi:hypothetical protein
LGSYFVSLGASHTFYFPGQVVKHLSNTKNKKNIAYNSCLTQNNSQKALQKKKKEKIDICGNC